MYAKRWKIKEKRGKCRDINNKDKNSLANKVEAAIDSWKKENPNAEVTVEIPGHCVTVKLCEAIVYVDQAGNLFFDAE